MKHGRGGFLASEFDALERNEALSLLVQCLAQLPPMLKKVLAMHYNENLPLADIAACCGLPESEIDQIHAQTLEVLQTMLAAELGLAVLRQADAKWTTAQSPTAVPKPQDAGLKQRHPSDQKPKQV